MNAKPKFEREAALKVAQEIYDMLSPFCERCKVAGSLRRGKRFVSDIEFLFIPKRVPDPEMLFNSMLAASDMISLADNLLNRLERDGVLKRRVGENGSTAWGPQNKLAVHVESGIPVDFFSTTEERWPVSLVIRTGGKQTNLMLTMGANKKGLKLNAYGEGFTNLNTGERIPCLTEEDVFRIAGVPFRRPEFRP